MKNTNYLRMKEGIKKMSNKKMLILIPIMYIFIMGVLTYVGEWFLDTKGNQYTSDILFLVFQMLMIEILVVGLMGIVYLLGTPLGSKDDEKNLAEIGFTDKNGKPPILISKRKEKKCIQYEFYSPTISLVKYKNHIADIETALTIKVVSVTVGKDIQHIIIRATKSGKENNDIIRWNDKYLSDKDFELVLGENDFGITESIDISKTPHLLIGGGSGSGKSMLLKCMLMQCIMKGADVILADFKGGLDYPKVWHEKCSIITDQDNLEKELAKILNIIEERRTLLINTVVPNIAEYNKKTNSNIKRIILACDEIAEVLDKTGLDKDEKAIVSQIEGKLSTIARLGRAFGIHLIFATQRPDSDILKGQIKTNIGYRICGRADKVLSQIILDKSEGAEIIPPDAQGMFYTNTSVLFKAYYVDDDCLEGGMM